MSFSGEGSVRLNSECYSSRQRFGQHLGHMPRTDGREMIDLMPATRAGGDHYSPVRLGANFLRERFGYFERKLVFGRDRAKRASHATAPGFQHTDSPAGHA